jgi:hypothetical protein
MQQMNRTAEYNATWTIMWFQTPSNRTKHAVGRASPNAGCSQRREYQAFLSKHRMKESKYKLSGRTHRNGKTAISWHIRFVVARNNTEPHAANPSQSARIPFVGGSMLTLGESVSGALEGALAGTLLAASSAQTPHESANARNIQVHTLACWRKVSQGSTSTG